MPVRFGLWRVDGDAPAIVPSAEIGSEERLEELIEREIDILGLGELMLVGRQVVTSFGKRVDLLAIDDGGDLVVIELKKAKTSREVVAQVLEYGFWVGRLQFEEIVALYAKHNDGADFVSAFTQHFGAEPPESLNVAHRLFVVASGLDQSTEQIVEYLRDAEVPINVLFFDFRADGEREYLARSWMADPDAATTAGPASGKKQPQWNGRDFFVAVAEDEHRSWQDMARFGFVSAGHGEKYRRAMSNLFVGARVFVAIPGSGYVGAGVVVDEAVPVDEFHVDGPDGRVPILEADIVASDMGDEKEDPALSEYVVRIRWLDTRPRDQAFWEKGMFANQNVVARLRQPFTLQRLESTFSLDEERHDVGT